MNIYLHELKVNRKFMISWLIAIMSLILLYISFFPSFNKEMKSFLKLMEGIPDMIKNIMDFNSETFGSILGYFSSFPMSFSLICAAISAMILGLSILSKEVNNKTADFLLTKPISRSSVVTSKLLASITLILINNILIFIFSYLFLFLISNESFDLKVFTLIILVILLIQLIFMSLGMFISVLFTKIKSIISIAMSTVIGLYFLNAFADNKLKLFTPFSYFDTTYILENKTYEFKYIWITLSLIIIFIVLTYLIYKKKDIYSI